jgi:hypothetical protein
MRACVLARVYAYAHTSLSTNFQREQQKVSEERVRCVRVWARSLSCVCVGAGQLVRECPSESPPAEGE